MLRLFRLLKPYRWAIAAVLILVLLQSLAELYLPTLMADIINEGVIKENIPYIWKIGGFMLLVTLLGAVVSVTASYGAARVSAGFGKIVRGMVFRQVETFSLQEFDKLGTASLITRTTNDINQVQTVLTMMLRMMVMAPMMCIGGIIMAMSKDPTLSLVFVVALPALAAAIGLIAFKAIPHFKVMQKKLDRLNLVLRESLTGNRVIRAFNRTENEKRRFDEANTDFTATAVRVNQLMALAWPVMLLIINLASLAIVWFGGLRIDNGHMQIGDLMAFIQYAMQIMFSLMMVSMLFVMVPRASASAVRINEVLQTEAAIVDSESPAAVHGAEGTGASVVDREFEGSRLSATDRGAEGIGSSSADRRAEGIGSSSADRASADRASAGDSGNVGNGTQLHPSGGVVVEFDNVTFRYPGAEQPALSQISFTAKPGEVTAIIGGTGSGKTTLLNLIPRFYDVEEGAVRIGGTDVRQMSQARLRAMIGFVPQKAILFTGTIADNIRFGKEDATDEEIRQAAEVAQAAEFIGGMPDGFDAIIAQGGTNVSGGQKQRLSIARAIVRRPAVYLFDDSFSALDFKTDARLRAALRPVTADSTVLIVAQRVSTVVDADQILVLDNGRIVGSGTHHELLQTNKVYQEIVASQLSEEEIA